MYAQDEFFEDFPSQWNNPPLTREAVEEAEQVLGFKLPASYLALLYAQNGGLLKKRRLKTISVEGYEDGISLTAVMGIGDADSIDRIIDGLPMSKQLILRWDLPDVGVVFSFFGKNFFLLDYTKCGAQGEPRILFVDADRHTLLVCGVAEDFGSLMSMLS